MRFPALWRWQLQAQAIRSTLAALAVGATDWAAHRVPFVIVRSGLRSTSGSFGLGLVSSDHPGFSRSRAYHRRHSRSDLYSQPIRSATAATNSTSKSSHVVVGPPPLMRQPPAAVTYRSAPAAHAIPYKGGDNQLRVHCCRADDLEANGSCSVSISVQA